jgi:glycosyltransferase involved in cell wall biosynthesis
LYVGRLAEEKGVLSLVAAMAILRRQRSDVKLYVVGDGSERPKAEQLVAENGLTDDVVFLGSRDHQQVASWIGASDLLCLPSLREGCPNVVLEALASGRPVVGTKVGGVPDLIDSRNGRLVPPHQPEALSAALNEVLNIDWDSAAIRHSVEDRSWRRAAGAYERVFRSAHDEAMTLAGEAV